MNHTTKLQKGFTLIELVIVVGIIGVLSVVAIISLSGQAEEARNARRKADMSALMTALAIECNAKGELIQCSQNASGSSTDPFDIVSSCQSPSNINLKAVEDPRASRYATVCDASTMANKEGCDYSMRLEGGSTVAYDPCDPSVLFSLEGENGVEYGCAQSTGVVTEGILTPSDCK